MNLFEEELKTLQENEDQILSIQNPSSLLSFLSYFNLPYFALNTSYAYTVIQETKKIVSFGIELNQLNIVTYDGKFYNAEFDMNKGGEFKSKICEVNFLA